MSNSKGGNELDQLVNRLPREIEPSTDHWPAIEQQLQHRHLRRQQFIPRHLAWPSGAMAAAVILALGVWMWSPFMAEQPVNNVNYATTSAEQYIVASYEQALANQLASANGTYLSVSDWWDTYRSFETAIDSILQALQTQPDEQFLLTQLQQTYQQKLRWVKQSTDSTAMI